MNRRPFSRTLLAMCLAVLAIGTAIYVVHEHMRARRVARLAPPATTVPSLMASDASASKQPADKPSDGASLQKNPKIIGVATQPSANLSDAARLAADSTAKASGAPIIAAAWSPTPAAVPSAPASNFIAAAAAKQSAGDLLASRQILNDALLSGKLNAFDTEATKKSLADVNGQIIFSPARFPEDEYGGTHVVRPGESLQKIAAGYDVPWQFLASINNLSDPRKMKSGAHLKIIKGPFTVVVSKGKFNMDVWLGSTPGQPGSMFVRSYSVGLGREDSTPTGTWMVGTKAKDPQYYSPRGEGVMAPDDPKNPLGHRWISINGLDGKALGAQSYGIHGTIDPDSIGKMASMGCIRMHNEDVAVLFDMLAEGKSIVVVQN